MRRRPPGSLGAYNTPQRCPVKGTFQAAAKQTIFRGSAGWITSSFLPLAIALSSLDYFVTISGTLVAGGSLYVAYTDNTNGRSHTAFLRVISR